jgi:protoporphyrinogen oxidase
MNAKRTAIIGGGMTGLALAYFLIKKGIRVTLFEKEDHLGGLAASFKVGAVDLEKFYHHFFARDSAALELLEELGIRDKFYWAYTEMGFFTGGKIRSFTTPLDLLAFSPLSLAERMKLGLFGLRCGRDLDWRRLEKISSREWLEQKLGKNIYNVIWGPMLREKFGRHADGVPAAWVWSRLRARSRSRGRSGLREKLGYLKGGYRVLINALADKIVELGGEIKLGSGVSAVPVPGYDLTVVTTPAAWSVPGIGYLGNICAVLQLREPFSRFYWVNIADDRIPFCAAVEHTNAFDDPGLNGCSILYLSNYVDADDPLWNKSDPEVFALYLEGLKRIDPGFSGGKVSGCSVFRDKFAQPLPGIGHSKKIPPFKLDERLYLVSNMQIYPEDRSINDSIKLAWTFAEQQ